METPLETFCRIFSVTPSDNAVPAASTHIYRISEAVTFCAIISLILLVNIWLWLSPWLTKTTSTGDDGHAPRQRVGYSGAGTSATALQDEELTLGQKQQPTTGFGHLDNAGTSQDHGESSRSIDSAEGIPIERTLAEAVVLEGWSGRLCYLDSLRVWLVIVVVGGHAVGTFTVPGMMHYSFSYQQPPSPLNESVSFAAVVTFSYLLQLLYFISGFFSPGSLQRRGARRYLQSKLQRLGLPMIFYSTVLDPALSWFVQVVMLRGANLPPEGYQYKLELGVAWFILWLLIFDVVHIALKDVKAPNVSLPALPWLIGWGFALGALQGLVAWLQGGQLPFDYGFLRLQWALAPSFAGFFACGTLAYRNQWLQELHAWTAGQKRTVFIMSFLTIAAIAPLLLFMQELPRAALMMIWGIFSGLLAVLISLSLLLSFKAVLNFSNGFTRVLGDGAYGAYLIHPWVLTPLAWSYGALLVATGVDLNSVRNNAWVLMGGSAYTILTAVPATWALSWSLRRIPGLKQVM